MKMVRDHYQKFGNVREDLSERDSNARITSTQENYMPTPVLSEVKGTVEVVDPHDDLLRRVRVTIDEWAQANNMQEMPQDIVFDQVVATLNAFGKTSRKYREEL